MPFLELHLDLSGLDTEEVESACFSCGALSITLVDAADTPILEPLPGTTPLWPSIRLSALYPEDTDENELA